MKKKDIPHVIRRLRKVMGLTQEQFAAKVGVTFSTVNRWENGRGKPSPLAMHRIKELMEPVGNTGGARQHGLPREEGS